jgi:hypothetical protein
MSYYTGIEFPAVPVDTNKYIIKGYEYTYLTATNSFTVTKPPIEVDIEDNRSLISYSTDSSSEAILIEVKENSEIAGTGGGINIKTYDDVYGIILQNDQSSISIKHDAAGLPVLGIKLLSTESIATVSSDSIEIEAVNDISLTTTVGSISLNSASVMDLISVTSLNLSSAIIDLDSSGTLDLEAETNLTIISNTGDISITSTLGDILSTVTGSNNQVYKLEDGSLTITDVNDDILMSVNKDGCNIKVPFTAELGLQSYINDTSLLLGVEATVSGDREIIFMQFTNDISAGLTVTIDVLANTITCIGSDLTLVFANENYIQLRGTTFNDAVYKIALVGGVVLVGSDTVITIDSTYNSLSQDETTGAVVTISECNFDKKLVYNNANDRLIQYSNLEIVYDEITGAYFKINNSTEELTLFSDVTNSLCSISATNKLIFNTNSVDRLTILSTGYIGINENTPDNLLHLTHTDNILLKLESTTADVGLLFIDTGASYNQIVSTNGNLKFLIDTTEYITLENTGLVGINCVPTASQLEIKSTASHIKLINSDDLYCLITQSVDAIDSILSINTIPSAVTENGIINFFDTTTSADAIFQLYDGASNINTYFSATNTYLSANAGKVGIGITALTALISQLEVFSSDNNLASFTNVTGGILFSFDTDKAIISNATATQSLSFQIDASEEVLIDIEGVKVKSLYFVDSNGNNKFKMYYDSVTNTLKTDYVG